MHTVVFGWFGASAVWFIPLLWRVAKSVLPNGGGLRGPGTIRLWLGFFCVLLASCTLEAALFHSFAFAADVDHLGHALLLGLGGRAGVIGTPAALGVGAGAAAVFLVSLPWLCGFRWRDTLGWANGAFGLGLRPEWLTPRERPVREKPSRGRASREKTETRGASAGLGSFKGGGPGAGVTTSGRTSHDAPALGLPTATQRQGGRYQRPTVWRPQPARRSESERPLRGPEAARPIEPLPQVRREPRAGKESYSDRFPDARPAASRNERGAGTREPIEPIAPAGWLKTGAASGTSSGTREKTAGVNAPAAATGAGAAGVTRVANAAGSAGSAGSASTVPPNVAPTSTTRATGRSVDSGVPQRPEVSRSSLNRSAPGAVRSSGSSSVSHAASRNTSMNPARGESVPPVVSSDSFFASTTSSTAVPPKPAGPPPAPERIKETLRSIEQSTAQWTTRGGSVDAAREAGAVPDASGVNSGQGAAAFNVAGASSALAASAGSVVPASAPITASAASLASALAPSAVSVSSVSVDPGSHAASGTPMPGASDLAKSAIASDSPLTPSTNTPSPTTPSQPAASASATQNPAAPPPVASTAALPHLAFPTAHGNGTEQASATNSGTAHSVDAHPNPVSSQPTPHVDDNQPMDRTPNPKWPASIDGTAPLTSSGASGNPPSGSFALPEAAAPDASTSPPTQTPTPTHTSVHLSDLPPWAIRAGQTHPVQTTQDIAATTPSSQVSASAETPSAVLVSTPPWQADGGAARPPFRVVDTYTAPAETEAEAETSVDAHSSTDTANGYAAHAQTQTPWQTAPEAQPEPNLDHASNVVHFPRAGSTFTPIPAPETTPPQPEPRPPVRGFIATEFEFHAPAASAVDLPGLDLLEPASDEVEPVSEQHLAETGQLIEQRLQEFKVPVTVVGASAGPVITRFEVEPALGVRGSQIVGLMKDLSRGLGLTSIRVVETIPGKTCMGLELPNAKRQMIRLSEILEADVYRDSKSFLTIAMGKDIIGNPVVTDLARAPHMLVAGTTGSGKSVAINAMILSLLYKAKPEDVRLIMIDPKMLELSVYEGIPHLLAPVVTDMKLAANALNWCVGEMEKRYKLMSAVGVRNLQGFNQKIRNAEAAGKKLTNPFSLTPDAPEPLAKLPMIVVVIDELADLMMVAGKQIEQLIARLAQKARAAGIHLILATQRPSVDVITGLIKANIPTRVAFQVSSKIDSRTILDQMGAESLLGAGDMLFLPPGTGYPQRVHGAFVADEEVHSVVEYLKQFGEPEYEEGILSGPTPEGGTPDLFGDTPDAEADPLYDEAVSFVLRTRRASISSVQRQLRIGYNRAARLVEQMETAGLVSPMGTNGNREVLAPGPAD